MGVEGSPQRSLSPRTRSSLLSLAMAVLGGKVRCWGMWISEICVTSLRG